MATNSDINQKLRPHQVEPVHRLVDIYREYQSAVDLSDMGTGKTYTAAAVATLLDVPTVAVVPKIAETAWANAAAHFGFTKMTVIGYEKLRTGWTPLGWWSNPPPEDDNISDRTFFKCQSCQLKVDMEKWQACYTHPLGIHCVETHRKAWDYGVFHWGQTTRFVIFDEVHRCGAMDSLTAEMLIGAKRQNIKVLGLSATAACNPLSMRALGFNLDLHNDKTDLLVPVTLGIMKGQQRRKRNFFSWASQFGCRRDKRFHGWKWMLGKQEQLECMANIRKSIIPARGVRVAVEDIPGFPKRNVTAELYDLEEGGAINQLYAEMADALAELEERSAEDMDHPLTRILRARQKIELLKVPVAIELASDAVDKGYSVGFFVNFAQTITELRARLKSNCVIDGKVTGEKRQRNIDSFQRNEERRIIINSKAGGVAVSLPDLTGDFPRLGLVFPGTSAVDFRQLLGRFHRENGKSTSYYKVLCAANTVEVSMHRNLCAKLNNLDAINDGDLLPESLHYFHASLVGLLNK